MSAEPSVPTELGPQPWADGEVAWWGLLLPHAPHQLCRAIWAIWGGKGPWAEGPSQPILAGELGQASVSPSVNKGVMMAVSG